MGRLKPAEWLVRLTGPDRQARRKAVGRVCQLAAVDADYVRVLDDALAHSNDNLVFWIVEYLGSLGSAAHVALAGLIQLLSRRPPFGTRQAILGALANIAPDAAEAKAAILGAFADPDPFVRGDALRAAIKVADLSPGDLARIREMGTDADEGVAFWSEVALRNIATRGQRPAEPVAAPDPAT